MNTELTAVSTSSPDRKTTVVADAAHSGVRLARHLAEAGHASWLADSADCARRVISMVAPDWVVLDPYIEPGTSLEFIREIAELAPQARIAVMTSRSCISTALEAFELGAVEFLCKPVAPAEVLQLIDPAAAEDQRGWLDVEAVKEAYIMEIFEQCRSVSKTARVLGIERRSLRRMMARFAERRAELAVARAASRATWERTWRASGSESAGPGPGVRPLAKSSPPRPRPG